MLFEIKNRQQTKNLAKQIATQAQIGNSFGLKGTLGVGKSFFAACFINSLLDKKIEVLSPTFNLLYSYQTKKGAVHHFDLYRLKDASELENIGFFDCLKNGICLIEWPEIAEQFLTKLLAKNYTEINIKIVDEKQRIFDIKPITN